jgi:hypothetical protein
MIALDVGTWFEIYVHCTYTCEWKICLNPLLYVMIVFNINRFRDGFDKWICTVCVSRNSAIYTFVPLFAIVCS